MNKTLYTVKIPTILAELVGTQNIREGIEEATREIFSEWAHPDILKRIQVTKPRLKGKEREEDG